MLNLKRVHSLEVYFMTREPRLTGRVISPVMAQAWFLSTKCRHADRGCGLLRMQEGTPA